MENDSIHFINDKMKNKKHSTIIKDDSTNLKKIKSKKRILKYKLNKVMKKILIKVLTKVNPSHTIDVNELSKENHFQNVVLDVIEYYQRENI